MNLHAMLDIETLGGSPRGCLIEIGVCFFTPKEIIPVMDKQHIIVDPASSQKHGMVLDTATVLWWMEQGGWKPRKEKVELPVALNYLDNAAEWGKLEGVWTNAPLFDLVILRTAYELCGRKPPWHYRQERCSRTMFYLANKMYREKHPHLSNSIPLPEREGIHHDALDDAIYQSKIVIELWSYIESGGADW